MKVHESLKLTEKDLPDRMKKWIVDKYSLYLLYTIISYLTKTLKKRQITEVVNT